MDMTEMVNDFKKETGFQRLFSIYHEKYRSYGYLENGLKATLNNPTPAEREALGGFMGGDYSKKKSISISVRNFEKAVGKTKYACLLQEGFMEQLIRQYYGENLISKKKQTERNLKYRKEFFEEYQSEVHPKPLRDIMKWAMLEENKGNRFLVQYGKGAGDLGVNLEILSKLFQLFPLKEPMYLPIFAAKVTRNPHTLDLDRPEGKLLIYALQVLLELETKRPMNKNLNAEDITELLLHFNILRDDLSNYVTLYNVEGDNQDGSINRLLQATSDSKATMNFPLKEVLKLSTVRAKGNALFMLENSSVSSYLVDEANRRGKDISVLSGNGNLRVATLKFLDLYTKTGGVVWYAGDYDPEGLGIAQRLIQRYGKSVRLWNYTEENYMKSLSDEEISISRLKQLKQITIPELTKIKAVMSEAGRAGYQENVLDELLQFGD
jgi:uncharacterized protein (TIGR02679 family)